MVDLTDYKKDEEEKDEKEETILTKGKHEVPVSHAIADIPDRLLTRSLLFCMLEPVDFDTSTPPQIKTFHNQTLNHFFDRVFDFLLLVDSEGDFRSFVKEGEISIGAKVGTRKETVMPLIEERVRAADEYVRFDTHDQKIILDFIDCFKKYFGSDIAAAAYVDHLKKINNITLGRFLYYLWILCAILYNKRHFRDYVHKKTVEMRLVVWFT